MADARSPDAPEPNGTPFAGLEVLCEMVAGLAGVDGAAVAAMMSAQSRELLHATDAVARRIDDLQFIVGEGPCLQAFTSQWPQLCPHLDAAGPRSQWLAFSSGVLELGVNAVFAFPIPGSERSLGVLELYRRAPGVLTDEQIDGAAQCAEAMGLVISEGTPCIESPTRSMVNVEAALVTSANPFDRSEVYVAAVIVALHLGVSPDEALARMRAHAYASEVSITTAAADIVTGRLRLDA